MKTCFLGLLLFASPALSQADTQTYTWRGIIDETTGDLGQVGDSISGGFTVDYGTLPNFTTPLSAHYAAVNNLQLTLNNLTVSQAGSCDMVMQTSGFTWQDCPHQAQSFLVEEGWAFHPQNGYQDTSLLNAREIDTQAPSLMSWAVKVFDNSTQTVREYIGHITQIIQDKINPPPAAGFSSDSNTCN